MKARILIILGLILLGKTIEAHPIHITVVNIDIKHDSNRIDYSVRLFYEDFQALINYRYNTMIDFSNQARMTFKEQQSIMEYIGSSFRLSDKDSTVLQPDFLSWKVEDMSVWLFFCVELKEKINELRVQNSLLVDLYNDQTNYVICKSADQEIGVEFNKRKTEHLFRF